MSASDSEIEASVTRLLRAAAKEYGEAVTAYGQAFLAYSRGDIDAGKVAEATFRVTLDGTRRMLDTGLKLGTAYARWSASLAGVEELKATAPDRPPPSSGKAKA